MVDGLKAHPGVHEEVERFTRLIAESPNDPSLYLQRALRYQAHGALAEAEIDVRKARERNGAEADLLFLLARIRFEQQRIRNALVLIRRVLRSSQRFLPTCFGLVLPQWHIDAGRDYDAALELFERPFPAQPDILVKRARAYVAAGDVAGALAGLDAGMAETGPLIALQELALDLEVESGQLEAAINRLDVILDTAPRKEGWLVRRGEVLASMGRFAEAERDVLAAEREIARRRTDEMSLPCRLCWSEFRGLKPGEVNNSCKTCTGGRTCTSWFASFHYSLSRC